MRQRRREQLGGVLLLVVAVIILFVLTKGFSLTVNVLLSVAVIIILLIAGRILKDSWMNKEFMSVRTKKEVVQWAIVMGLCTGIPAAVIRGLNSVETLAFALAATLSWLFVLYLLYRAHLRKKN